mmetsp:Transcript_26894/g.53795  ORF Transcript_26894/g.53795 Transcript_26894/m.53795 type:complete len:85 (+) Transcript_26894:1276-1530(+)
MFTQEQPSHSIAGPQQQHGRHGAPGLQQTSALQQQRPIFPEHPKQVAEGYVLQLAQQRAQQSTNLSSSTASSFPMFYCLCWSNI